jgi:DNA-directed RNA polymerase subunit beta'
VPAAGLIDEVAVQAIETAGVEHIKIRSVLTCETEEGVCATCYGRDLARGTMVNVGEAVGVIAAQSIGEPGTQLTMRTFHIGGAVSQTAQQSSIESNIDGTLSVENRNAVNDSTGTPVIMSRNCELVLRDEQGRERARHRVPYGSRLLVDHDQAVSLGTKLAEWDPHMRPVVSEKSGTVKYLDLVEGVTMREEVDEATGIASRRVIEWKQTGKTADLRPRVLLVDENGEPVTLSNGREAQFELPINAVLSVEVDDSVHAGDVLARIPLEGSKARDITGGLPRVAELFEARKPKDFAIMAESDGRVEFGKDYKAKRRLVVVPEEEGAEPTEYLVPKGKPITVQEGDFVRKGDLLMDGSRVPHDILKVLGVAALASYLINEIQEVYRLQGVKINDKHIEVISRQMLQKMEIDDPGETTFLNGEQVD